ncbi:hypothetical protein [Marinifilum sp. D737]|uniref:hypothetical protein n=1 Tax=Marinifilum sp. D737 TaxID=2969628 RepID=UPI002273684D|nr:hypothetical protein [Marinifilum sp. D737]MCY1633266.1 hypothetical protein [Marinifilum sp. D737]
MNAIVPLRISKDLKESQIDWKIIILFLPIAFFTFFFHEFGHWTFGEILGNDMTLSLNNSTTSNGNFKDASHALWSAIGGPLFTIIQALLFSFVVWKTKSILAYSFVFVAVFSRFYSIVFGGIVLLQDETRIALKLGVNKYLISGIVLAILFSILWKCHKILKLNLKALGYFIVLGVFAILIVIGLNELIK